MARLREQHLQRYLMTLVRRLRRLVEQHIIPELNSRDAAKLRRSLADLALLLEGAINEKALLTAIRRMLRRVQRFAVQQITEQIRKVSPERLAISPVARSPRLARALAERVHESARLIKTIPKRYHERVSRAVLEGIEQGRSTKAILKEIYAIGRSTARRAELIARDQVGKGLASIMEAQQRDLGLKKFRWVTSRDERVRPAHRRLDGKVFTWAQGAPRHIEPAGYPGMAPLCRCAALPIYEELRALFKKRERT